METHIRDYFKYRDRERLYTTLVLLFFTAGTYVFIWMFLLNRDFEKLDENAPESRRALVVLFLLPLVWNSIYLALEVLVLNTLQNQLILLYIQAIGWTIVVLLAIKYVYDFSLTFAKLTKTHTMVWYLGYFIGMAGLLMFILNIQWAIWLIFVPFIFVFLMQMEINKTIEYANRNKTAASFNTQKRYL